MSTPSEETRILEELAAGDPTAAERLLPLVYDRLRARAAALMAERPRQVTLQPTALVHEAYLRLVGKPRAEPWSGRAHFLAVAAKAMRHVLIDAARRRRADKRGGGVKAVTLTESGGSGGEETSRDADLLDLDEALEALTALHPRHARVAELRWFAGLSVPEAAEALGVSPTIVKEEWAMARAWLRRRLEGEGPGGP
jgi:RNA polymerase sigma factor (TIGR02999 family)